MKILLCCDSIPDHQIAPISSIGARVHYSGYVQYFTAIIILQFGWQETNLRRIWVLMGTPCEIDLCPAGSCNIRFSSKNQLRSNDISTAPLLFHSCLIVLKVCTAVLPGPLKYDVTVDIGVLNERDISPHMNVRRFSGWVSILQRPLVAMNNPGFLEGSNHAILCQKWPLMHRMGIRIPVPSTHISRFWGPIRFSILTYGVICYPILTNHTNIFVLAIDLSAHAHTDHLLGHRALVI